MIGEKKKMMIDPGFLPGSMVREALEARFGVSGPCAGEDKMICRFRFYFNKTTSLNL